MFGEDRGRLLISEQERCTALCICCCFGDLLEFTPMKTKQIPKIFYQVICVLLKYVGLGKQNCKVKLR